MHQMRDIETHRRNTWLWDEWGFTENIKHGVSLSDVDGFFCNLLETNYQFLIVEMKHWDGAGECPKINLGSGQAIALKRLSEQKNFTVMIGYGDTSTKTIYETEIWWNGQTSITNDFKAALGKWWTWARNT